MIPYAERVGHPPQSAALMSIVLMATLSLALHLGCVPAASGNSGAERAVPFTVLDDQMGSHIVIGVPRNITEQQLRATLVKAADQHQDDPARDYLTSAYFLVEAYLVDEGHRSTAPAGRLRRFVPFKNAAERKRLAGKRKTSDTITIALEEAKRSLK